MSYSRGKARRDIWKYAMSLSQFATGLSFRAQKYGWKHFVAISFILATAISSNDRQGPFSPS